MRKPIFLSLIFLCQVFAGPAAVYLTTARIAYFNEKDYKRAKKACLEGIEKEPNNFELYTILGGCEIGLGNWQDGANALINALTIDSTKTVNWISKRPEGENYYYQTFYFSARELFDQEKYDEALKIIKYAYPPDIGIYTLKGAIFYKQGNTAEATKAYQKALDIDPQNPDVNFLIGKVLFDSQVFDSSINNLEVAIKNYNIKYERITKIIFQNLTGVNKELAQKINKLWAEQKLEELEELIKTDLKFPQGLVEQKGNIEQFYKITSDLARSYYFKGMSYHYLKADSLGLNNLMVSLELKPDNLDALYFTGEAMINLTKYQEAKEYFEKVIRIKEDDHYAWFYLAVCYTQLKDYKEAIDIYENRVLVLDPANIDALTNLASLYRALGNQPQANKYLIKADSLQKR